VRRVLIAEDDRVIAATMATHLRHAGFAVEVADRGDRAIRKLRFERPDVAVIDLMLPGTARVHAVLRRAGTPAEDDRWERIEVPGLRVSTPTCTARSWTAATPV
jgi:CheY-like chemotaxis protein